jgi:hypothetical protein
MKFLEIYKIIILWVGCLGCLIYSLEYGNWLAFGGFSLLALTAIVFNNATIKTIE